MSDNQNRIPEGTGHITSDSLAAESLRGNPSQGFAANERELGPAPSSQPSHGTTANTTDTSGADVLDPARKRQDRLTETQVQGKDYQTPAEIPGLDKFADHTHSKGSGGGGSGGAYDTSRGGPEASYGGSAPTGIQPGTGVSADHLKVKGKNIHEVDTFDNEERAPNASFEYGQDIGGKNDPARRAEQAFANANSQVADDSGYPSAGKQGFQGGKGGYENLESDERA